MGIINNKIGKDIRIGPNRFSETFQLRHGDGREAGRIIIGITCDDYHNPMVHISPVDEENGTEIFENKNTLQYNLLQICEDAGLEYLEGKRGVIQICKSLRRVADILECKYEDYS